MAKCTKCNSRKGKRKCLATDTFICSLCCGESRTAETCQGCSYYKDPRLIRNYKSAPHFSLNMMSNLNSLQDQANVIESAFCSLDDELENNFNDNDAIRLAELLLDHYHFNDNELKFKNELEGDGFSFINSVIENDLKNISKEQIVKIIGTIYRSIKRHTSGRREYLDFIQQHVGLRVGSGIRAIKNFL
jgi:hypothetical protein